MMKMRTTYQRDEILLILEAAKEQNDPLTLWQFDGEERRLFKGRLESVDEEKNLYSNE